MVMLFVFMCSICCAMRRFVNPSWQPSAPVLPGPDPQAVRVGITEFHTLPTKYITAHSMTR